LNVTADASASTDPIGISTYTFDFGDGTVVGPQAGSTAAHTYNATGPYTVKVTVADSVGGTSSATNGVTVAAPPNAALTVTPASGPAPVGYCRRVGFDCRNEWTATSIHLGDGVRLASGVAHCQPCLHGRRHLLGVGDCD
jgi:hypothetical protein